MNAATVPLTSGAWELPNTVMRRTWCSLPVNLAKMVTGIFSEEWGGITPLGLEEKKSNNGDSSYSWGGKGERFFTYRIFESSTLRYLSVLRYLVKKTVAGGQGAGVGHSYVLLMGMIEKTPVKVDQRRFHGNLWNNTSVNRQQRDGKRFKKKKIN